LPQQGEHQARALRCREEDREDRQVLGRGMPFSAYPSRHGRHTARSTREMVAATHHLAAQAGLAVLEAGGNGGDAGVCAGLVTGVVESEYAAFAGVAPIILYLAATREIVTIDGLGVWPRAASCGYFHDRFGGDIPPGFARSVVPGAPDSWITAL